MPYIGKKPENIIATAIDTTTGDFSGVVTANAGIKVDNITIDGSEIDLSGTGDFTVDVGGDIIIDSDGADILLKHDGTHWGSIFTNATPNNLYIQSMISDASTTILFPDIISIELPTGMGISFTICEVILALVSVTVTVAVTCDVCTFASVSPKTIAVLPEPAVYKASGVPVLEGITALFTSLNVFAISFSLC